MLSCSLNIRLRLNQQRSKVSQTKALYNKVGLQTQPRNTKLLIRNVLGEQFYQTQLSQALNFQVSYVNDKNNELYSLGEGLETPVQLIYLLALLGFLVVGAYLVVRQVLIKRELEEAAKVLGERIRSNKAGCEDFFELGVILLRKKLYTQASKNLEKAKSMWDGEEQELAQLHNALGFAYFSLERYEEAINEYEKGVELQPGYTICLNNLGDAYETTQQLEKAVEAYEAVLRISPDNKIAEQRASSLKSRLSRIS
eukprot:TRINITY_DN5543_c0_g3_i1.p2 TRINITY_DN5543_c0_g3~~TRINITY_DN5543_c0_g3_i1.p2  ORF type:complete len:255 (+),score=28.65 TRINITY_DN5543_c0_g3_i1:94-858(+)